MNHIYRGFIVPLLVVIIALFILGGGYVYTQKSNGNQAQPEAQATSIASTTNAVGSTASTTEDERYGSSLYHREGDRVYFYIGHVVISDANLAYFTLVPGNEDYATDKFHVWYRGVPLKDVSSATFTVINGSDYGTDGGPYVWFRGERLPYQGIDMKTFTTLARDLAKDKNNVYFGLTPLQLDPDTIVVKGSIIKDTKTVYLRTDEGLQPIANADAPSFVDVGVCGSADKSSAEYYKDKNHVYVDTKVQPTIDASTFVYLGLVRDPEGTMPLSVAYAKDSRQVYSGCGQVVEGRNP